MNQNLMIPWIRSETPKATDITNLLEEVIRKKRGWNLDGSSEEYDFFHGCYGNPDSEYLFVAEIPSFSGCQVARQLYRSQPGMSWKSAWKISTGDLIYRISLSDSGLIENPLSDEPWTWKCWLTDLVKCPHSDGKWKDMKRNHEADDILWQSAEILRREFEIINPKSVIIVGQETANLFGK